MNRPSQHAFDAAQADLTQRETVALPHAEDESFGMHVRPATIETWLGDTHAAGD